MDSGCNERAHWPVPPVRTGSEFRKVQIHDMPDEHSPVRDVIVGSGTTAHRKGVDVPQAI